MAKASSTHNVNKSEEIRKMLTENPGIPVKEAVEQLAKKGVIVIPAQVYQQRAKLPPHLQEQKAAPKKADKRTDFPHGANEKQPSKSDWISAANALLADCDGDVGKATVLLHHVAASNRKPS